MKLTPDKKGELLNNNSGARPKIPKVQKSMSVASETLSQNRSSVQDEVGEVVAVINR